MPFEVGTEDLAAQQAALRRVAALVAAGAVSAEVFPWQLVTYDGVEAAPLGSGRFALHPFGVSAPLYLAPRPLEIASETLW